MMQVDVDHLRRTIDEVQKVLRDGIEQTLTVVEGVDETAAVDASAGSETEALLRRRLAFVTAQLRDRTQLEAVRLHEVLIRQAQTMRQDLEDAFEQQRDALVHNERREFEEALRRQEEEFCAKMEAMEQELDEAAQEKLQLALEGLKADMTRDQEGALRAQAERLTAAHMAEAEDRWNRVAQLRTDTEALRAHQLWHSDYEKECHKTHKAAVAAFSVARSLHEGGASGSALVLLRLTCSDDDFVQTVCKAAPASVYSHGSPTTTQLRNRLAEVKEAALLVAHQPADGFFWHLLGRFTSLLLINPQPADADGTLPHERFARAEGYLDAGDLVQAVVELKALEIDGYTQAAKHARDWIADAEQRAVLDQTLDLLLAHVSLLSASLS